MWSVKIIVMSKVKDWRRRYNEKTLMKKEKCNKQFSKTEVGLLLKKFYFSHFHVKKAPKNPYIIYFFILLQGVQISLLIWKTLDCWELEPRLQNAKMFNFIHISLRKIDVQVRVWRTELSMHIRKRSNGRDFIVVHKKQQMNKI